MAVDLFTQRVLAFRALRAELETLGEPTGLDAYKKKLEVKAGVEKDFLMDAESMMAKLRMQSALAEDKYRIAEEFEEKAYEKGMKRAKAEQAQTILDTEAQSALALRSMAGFDTKGGLLGRELAPGQSLRKVLRIKKFNADVVLKNSADRLGLINIELANLKKTDEANLPGSGQRRQALMEEIVELDNDLNNPITAAKMQKADEQELALYDAYIKNIQSAKSYLGI